MNAIFYKKYVKYKMKYERIKQQTKNGGMVTDDVKYTSYSNVREGTNVTIASCLIPRLPTLFLKQIGRDLSNAATEKIWLVPNITFNNIKIPSCINYSSNLLTQYVQEHNNHYKSTVQMISNELQSRSAEYIGINITNIEKCAQNISKIYGNSECQIQINDIINHMQTMNVYVPKDILEFYKIFHKKDQNHAVLKRNFANTKVLNNLFMEYLFSKNKNATVQNEMITKYDTLSSLATNVVVYQNVFVLLDNQGFIIPKPVEIGVISTSGIDFTAADVPVLCDVDGLVLNLKLNNHIQSVRAPARTIVGICPEFRKYVNATYKMFNSNELIIEELKNRIKSWLLYQDNIKTVMNITDENLLNEKLDEQLHNESNTYVFNQILQNLINNGYDTNQVFDDSRKNTLNDELLLKDYVRIFSNIFNVCVNNGCQSLHMIPIGTGAFMANLGKLKWSAIPVVLSAMADAFKKSSLNTVYFSRGANKIETLKQIFKDFSYEKIESYDIFSYNNHKIIVHEFDAIKLAVKLKTEKPEIKQCVVNASDMVAVLFGYLGYYWETGYDDPSGSPDRCFGKGVNDFFAGEEYLASTTTLTTGLFSVIEQMQKLYPNYKIRNPWLNPKQMP